MKKRIKLTESGFRRFLRKCINESLKEQQHYPRYGYYPSSEDEMEDFYWRNGPAGRYEMDYYGYDEDGCGGKFYSGNSAEDYDVPQWAKDEEWRYFPDGEDSLMDKEWKDFPDDDDEEDSLMEAKLNRIIKNSIRKYLR